MNDIWKKKEYFLGVIYFLNCSQPFSILGTSKDKKICVSL